MPPKDEGAPTEATRSRQLEDLDRIYAELRRHAQSLLADERPGHTLQATALVNEAIAKLLSEGDGEPITLPADLEAGEQRRLQFAMISRRMRQVLVEHARARNAQKRCGEWTQTPLHEALAAVERQGIDVVELDRALGELQSRDPEAAIVFQHRWFGGLSMAHIACVLEVDRDEVQQRWNRARRALQSIMARERR